MNNRYTHAILAAIPVLITPLLFYMLAEGWLNAGGGEKDILLAFPYFLWALTFFIVALVLIIKRWPLKRWLLRAGFVSILLMLALGVFAYITSLAGIA